MPCLRGKQDIVFFRKRLSKESILRAITQTWLALFLVVFIAMILSVVNIEISWFCSLKRPLHLVQQA